TVLPRRHLPRLPGPARERPGHPARGRHPPVPSPLVAGPRPGGGRGQRRLTGEGGRDAAAGVRETGSRTGSGADRGGEAGARLSVPGDGKYLAAALRCLLDSPAERGRLSAAAWQRVQERFTWSAVARATVAEYERAIAAQRRPSEQDRTAEQARTAERARTGD